MTLLAVHAAVLAALSGERDVVIAGGSGWSAAACADLARFALPAGLTAAVMVLAAAILSLLWFNRLA